VAGPGGGAAQVHHDGMSDALGCLCGHLGQARGELSHNDKNPVPREKSAQRTKTRKWPLLSTMSYYSRICIRCQFVKTTCCLSWLREAAPRHV
jgi:hypothetical protein